MADRMFSYVLIISIYHLTKSNLGSSLPMLAFGLPAILFSVPFGVFVDRFKKKQILFFSNLCRAGLILLIIGVPFFSHSVIGLFLISFILYTISQLFNPAELAAITHTVHKKELILANSLFMGTWMLSSIISFGLAVPIVYNYGIMATFWVTTGLYLLAALFILLFKTKEDQPTARTKFSSIRRELRAGIRFVLKHRIVFYSMFQMGFGVSLLAILSATAINFVDKVLGRPDSDFGYLVAIAGIGMGYGIALMGKMANRFKKLTIVSIGFSLAGAMLILLGFTRTIIEAFVIVFFLGMGNAFINAPIQTIIQERTPKDIRGKVFSIQNLVASFAFSLPPIVAALAADMFGHLAVFATVGVASLLLNFNIRKLQK
jgi:MFS family permease